ncbi:MAG: hypothetical protein WC876_10745, partial [Candidatus Thermoplasmatota archaeon]
GGDIIDALNGKTSHPWCDDVSTSGKESCEDQLVGALRDASAELGSDQAAWRIPIHMSQFKPIGGTNPDRIPMVNRGSWNQVVALGQGLTQAQGVLPPGNSGLYTPLELLMVTAGADVEPASLTAELNLYTEFDYKPLPVTADEVDSVAVSTMTLDVLH